MLPRSIVSGTLLALFLFSGLAHAQKKPKPKAWTKPNRAKKQDADFLIQGEYVGEVEIDNRMEVGTQIIALGDGKFTAKNYIGGLPGDGATGGLHSSIEGTTQDDGSVLFRGEQADGVLKDGAITIVYEGDEVGTLKKVTRKSKTLGKKPPSDAVVLFNGKSNDHWDNAVMDGKLLAFDPKGRGATSKEKFGSHSVHIEFRLPYIPTARGQGRGNSGIYLQSRYEVQMLDSFGLDGKDNECGGIYKIAKPKVNMCYPPLTWQTYDIDFNAAEYNDAGEVVKNPTMTVRHNGVLIHEDLELPHRTTASPLPAGPEDAPIYLQNHGNPVRYRNIWVVKKAD